MVNQLLKREFYNSLKLLYSDQQVTSDGYSISIIEIGNMPIHFTDSVDLIMVLKGEFRVKVSFNDYSLKEGDLLLLNPYEVRALYSESKKNLVLCAKFNKNKFANYLFIFDYDYYNSVNNKNVDRVRELLLDLYIEKYFRNNNISSVLNEIINIIDKNFQIQEFDIINKTSCRDSYSKINLDRVKHAYEIQYFDYERKLRLKDFADTEHIDFFYASRLFKDISGTGFQESINTIRVDRAEVFLLGTDLPIQDICTGLGFSSYDYFVKNFKQIFGSSPSKYRKKYLSSSYPTKSMDFKEVALNEFEFNSIVTAYKLTEIQNIKFISKEMLAEMLDNVYLMISESDDGSMIEDGTVKLSINDKEYLLNVKDKDSK